MENENTVVNPPIALTVEEQIRKIDAILLEYTKKVNIYNIEGQDATYYYNLTSTELRKLSIEDLLEGASILSSAATYIQREVSKETARRDWAENALKYVIAPLLSSYNQYMPVDHKTMLAVRENEYARKLYQLTVESKLRTTTLSYMPARFEFKAQTFMEIAKARRNNNRSQ